MQKKKREMDNESKYHYGREIICTLKSCTAISERVYLHWLEKINSEEKLEAASIKSSIARYERRQLREMSNKIVDLVNDNFWNLL